MKKIAFLLTLIILCTTIVTPALAATKKDASSAAPSSSASSKDAKASSSSKGASSVANSSSSNASSKDTATGKDASSDVKTSSGKDGSSSSASSDSAAVATDTSSTTNSLTPPFAAELHSKAVCLINLDSDQVVWQRNEQEKIYPASLTKVMTCIIALESGKDLKRETTSLKAYIQNELYNKRVDTLGGIYMGEEMVVYELLYAMMLQSANEAAMMVADYIGDGNLDLFYEMMNKKAKELGAKNTNFCNPTGLFDENNYSTAADMSLIVKYAMTIPEFKEIVTTRAYTSSPTPKHPEGIDWYSINYMQIPSNTEYYYEGLQGVKTGSLPASETGGQGIRNFASTATRDGYSYLLILMGAPAQAENGLKYENILSFIDARKLYDWAFANFTVKTLMSIGKEVSEVNVRLSWDTDRVNLVAQDKFASLVPNETTQDSVEAFVEINKDRIAETVTKKGEKDVVYINAPVEKGELLGYAKLMLNGKEVGRVPLVAAKSVTQSKALAYVDVAKKALNNFFFKFVVTFILVVLILYVVLMIIRNHNRRRYKMRRGGRGGR